MNQAEHTSTTSPAEGGGRRSRAANRRRPPTTLLNASPTNFRALVQHFTGCPTPHQSSPLPPHESYNNHQQRQTQTQTQKQEDDHYLESQQQQLWMPSGGVNDQNHPFFYGGSPNVPPRFF